MEKVQIIDELFYEKKALTFTSEKALRGYLDNKVSISTALAILEQRYMFNALAIGYFKGHLIVQDKSFFKKLGYDISEL